jgi:FtsH-binding integral membrane protein
MSTVTNYVDVSTKSLAIASIVFLIVVFAAKYILDMYSRDTKEEDKRSIYLTMTYCILIGLVFAGLTLVAYKQFCKFGACDILTDPFPSKM